MVKVAFILTVAVVCARAVPGQAAPDSTRVPLDTTVSDSTVILTDSLFSYEDILPDSLLSDTLTEAQKAQLRFEARRKMMQESREEEFEYIPPVSYFDSLTSRFAPRPLDKREVINRSFYHDPGDYYRFDPGYFIVDRQATPMRKTVQPYTLSGNRLNVMQGSSQLHPFEHSIEPDGLMDLNDIPTALDDQVYTLDGPAGMVFGADQGVATLLTLPGRYDDNDAHSAFLVDKGSYGYSYARARYLRKFTDGRTVNFSIGYRNSDGPYLSTDDDAYHYTGEIYTPVRGNYALRAKGRLYDREGPLRIQPDISGTVVRRDRFDRSADVALQRNDDDRSGNWQLHYRYLRGSSDIFGVYLSKFNQFGHGTTIAREWADSSRAFRAEINLDNQKYDNSYDSYDRTGASAFVNIADLSDGWRFALRAGTRWSEDYDVTPSVAVTALRQSHALFLMLSAGYMVREPSLQELHHPYRRTTIYPVGSLNYADRGNDSLSKETQFTASAVAKWGTDRASVTLSATGGRIVDGIDWIQTDEVIEGSLTRVFGPHNGDIDFANLSVEPSFKLWDLVRFSAGGAYHYTDYELYADTYRPYAPDYQMWAGTELHVFWPQKLIHLYAYGEVTYTSIYDGYYELNLGQDPVFNAKLSLQMGRFRWHFIFQNLLNRVYESREFSSYIGRYNSYGFVWEFLN